MTESDFMDQKPKARAKEVVMSNTHMSEFPIVWIIPQVKCACREKLELSQCLRRSFLYEEVVIYFFIFEVALVPCDASTTTPLPLSELQHITAIEEQKREDIAVPWLHRSHWLVCLGQVRNLESARCVRILERKTFNEWTYAQISLLFIHQGLQGPNLRFSDIYW